MGTNNEPRPKTAADLAAERIARDPELLRNAALVQRLLESLRRNTLAHATPEERASDFLDVCFAGALAWWAVLGSNQ